MNRAVMFQNTLQNPGFEDTGAVGKMSDWTVVVHAGNSYRVEQDQSLTFSGKRSLVIENTGEPEFGGVVQISRAEGLAAQGRKWYV